MAFNITIPDFNKSVEFEIENDALFPEFDVLKPYFAKWLKSKNIEIAVYAEFEKGELIAQSASSESIEKINQELIESVRFSFIKQNIAKRKFPEHAKNALTLNELHGNTSLYDTDEELLSDFLKDSQIRHFRSLRYLASKHRRDVLKIRFVLRPFAFLFLLSGEEQYHIVMETHNTEEATYIWHIEKSLIALKSTLESIDKDLATIKNSGRDYFLQNAPPNFSKIIHDYSDDRKGFVIWRELLEERLR